MEREKLVSMIRSLQNGDENAATDLFNSFHNDIYYYIYKTVNDAELAADLTQDTFIEILQSINSLQEPAAFVTWSRKIAYRRCTAYFKKRHDILADEDEDGYSVFDTLEEDRKEFIPDEALDKEELKRTVHEFLASLPEEQRSAIMMRYFEEIPVADIAKIQGVSEGTVKSRLNYARKAIKQAVEGYEEKHKIKLHCVGIVPLLLWLMREYRLSGGLSLTTGAPKASAASSASIGGSVSAKLAPATAKATSFSLAGKIIAGIAAAGIAIGGTVFGLSQTGLFSPKDEPIVNPTYEYTKEETSNPPISFETTREEATTEDEDQSVLTQEQSPSATTPDPTTEEDKSPKFESEHLSVYADQFQGTIKKLYKAENGVIYVETTDGGFYHAGDAEKENNLLSQDIASWEYKEFVGLITVDNNGYYHLDGEIAHGINGEIFYAFNDMLSSDLVVYSVDSEGYVYFNRFSKTGKKLEDNVKLSFEEKSQDGYSFTHLGIYDKVEYLRVLPAKGSYVSSPNVLLRVNGKTYVEQFSAIVNNTVSLVTNFALSQEESKNFLDYYSYKTTYFKDGVNDKLFYMYDGDEYVLNLPDSHTVDEIKYFNRGNNDMLLFTNGDVYIWQGKASILGENAVKHQELSKIGTEIQEVIFCNNVYRVLMSDGVIYTINSTSDQW